MCDINQSTKLKHKTVYKVAWLIDGKYYSCFSHHELRVGKVITWPALMIQRSRDMFKGQIHNSLNNGSNLYNKNMLGRVSGFALKSDAVNMCTKNPHLTNFIGMCLNDGHTIVVLRMVLSGSILRGTTYNIADSIPSYHDTYAGDHIDSITELLNHKK